jgi:regulator of cell morphogenesis and NO signaling
MQFIEKTKMADIIHRNYLLLPILNRFDIQLGFGDKTVQEICTEQGINIDFFLVILNSFHDHDYFPQEKLLEFPLRLMLDYIKKSHSYYLETKMPQIEGLIRKLTECSEDSRKRHLRLIEKFFSEYKSELVEHIREEEDDVYPYAMAIDKAYTLGKIEKQHGDLIRRNPIAAYAQKHDNIEDKLFDLKNIIIKYLPPIKDNSISNSLLVELFRLERDLNDHARIEDKVLFPKVEFIENEILEKLQ